MCLTAFFKNTQLIFEVNKAEAAESEAARSELSTKPPPEAPLDCDEPRPSSFTHIRLSRTSFPLCISAQCGPGRAVARDHNGNQSATRRQPGWHDSYPHWRWFLTRWSTGTCICFLLRSTSAPRQRFRCITKFGRVASPRAPRLCISAQMCAIRSNITQMTNKSFA